MTIGFIGNFIPPHSTENDRKWSFEKLGNKVVQFQENETTAKQLLNASPELDLLMYSHTHDPSYVIPGLINVFQTYKQLGIPTASAHLDRWLGLKRVEDVGTEATWFTEHIFMADCSPEAVELYDKLGLNWHYLKPGVIERDCYMAEPDPVAFPHEIVFVGSKGYHPEHNWRPRLIEWLHDTYGSRFAHWGNDGAGVVRGDSLNKLYTSAKVVVGDSCFSGRTSNYWSDRIAETTGRGGFLIHPESPGCDHKGVAWFRPEDFDSLRKTIDYYLSCADEREVMRREGFEWTRENATYTQRAREILQTVFG